MGTIPVIAAPPGAGQPLPNAYLLKVKQTVDFWGLTPRCYAYQTATTSIASGATPLTVLGLDTEVYNVANSYDGGSDAAMHSTTNNSRIYARTAGKYEITGQVMFAANATGGRVAQARVNAAGDSTLGTLVSQGSQGAVTAAGIATGVPIPTVEIVMAAGDYVELFGSQTSGGALSTSAGQFNTYLRLKLTGS